MINREIIAERVKRLRIKKDTEDASKKKVTDSGQKPDQIVLDPEIHSITGQIR
jgi:hypothetical protein